MKGIALTLAVATGVLAAGPFASAAPTTGTRGLTPAAAPPPSLKIKVLSNRADLLSGGDALVEIRPQGKVDRTP